MKSVLTIFAALGLVIGLNGMMPGGTAQAFPTSVPVNILSDALLSRDHAFSDVQKARYRRRGFRRFRRHRLRRRHRHLRRHHFSRRLRHYGYRRFYPRRHRYYSYSRRRW